MLAGTPKHVVFEWLAEGLDSAPPAYLQLLGPSQSERGDRVLTNLEAVAGRLRERPAFWGELIQSGNWRHTLVGCSAVLMARDPRFLGDLLETFRRGSWVAPQLAVALGLVHPTESSGELAVVMSQQGNPANPKTVFSAYAVLKLMGHQAVDDFERSVMFRRARSESTVASAPANGWFVADHVVRRHWDFWVTRMEMRGHAR